MISYGICLSFSDLQKFSLYNGWSNIKAHCKHSHRIKCNPLSYTVCHLVIQYLLSASHVSGDTLSNGIQG